MLSAIFPDRIMNVSHFETYIEYQNLIVIRRMLTCSLITMFVNLFDDPQVH